MCGGRDTSRVAIQRKTGPLLWQIACSDGEPLSIPCRVTFIKIATSCRDTCLLVTHTQVQYCICTLRKSSRSKMLLPTVLYCITIDCMSYAKLHIQYGHLIPAPVDRTSAHAWLCQHPWITCQEISQAHQ